MAAIQVTDVAFGFAAQTLFEGVTFTLNSGERAALVAPNGAGKTTLLRIIASEITPDRGAVAIDRNTRVAFYRQSHELASTGTVLDALMSGFGDVVELRAELGRARSGVASGDLLALARLARLEDKYHLAQGDALEHQVQAIAGKLGFAAQQLGRPVASLSGGERGRLRLGVVLAQQPELLLLDEPTNHLDLGTIAWLEQHLLAFRGAVLLVSHDRAFLDNVCPRTLELGSRSWRDYPLRYSDYVIEREGDLERERAAAGRQQEFVDKTEDFVRRNLAGQKTKQAQSRRRMLEKLDRLDRPRDIFDDARHMSMRFAPAPRSGDIVIDATSLGACRGGRQLFENFDLLVRRGERISIVGPNGCGKTTLLRLLAARNDSADTGTVQIGSNICMGYFDQELGSLDLEKSAIDEIRSVRGDMNADTVRQYLSRFRFFGDLPFQLVAAMSGGERTRLALAKMLLEPRNLLLLDEPTNHLDIPAAEILEQALVQFDGTVLFVSHDRRFLDTVSTRLIAFCDGGVRLYPGGYRDWTHNEQLRARAAEPQVSISVPRRGQSVPPAAVAAADESEDAKRTRRAQFENDKAAGRIWERKARRFQELEMLIAQAEEKLAGTRQTLRALDSSDWEILSKLAEDERRLEQQVQEMMDEWSELGEQLAARGSSLEGSS